MLYKGGYAAIEFKENLILFKIKIKHTFKALIILDLIWAEFYKLLTDHLNRKIRCAIYK